MTGDSDKLDAFIGQSSGRTTSIEVVRSGPLAIARARAA